MIVHLEDLHFCWRSWMKGFEQRMLVQVQLAPFLLLVRIFRILNPNS
jgi:hypothetical protein